MFRTLLESRAVTARRTGGSVASALLHVGIIGALVLATANAAQVRDAAAPLDVLHFTKVDPPAPVLPQTSSPASASSSAPAVRGFSLEVPSIDIPSILPSVDLSIALTRGDDFLVRGDPGGTSIGRIGGRGVPTALNGVYSELQVDRPVAVTPGTQGPLYPEPLRAAGIEGAVLAQFIVDTLGRAELASFVAVKSDQPQFAEAVRTALARMRFLPAEAGGRKVRQLVQQSFQFSVTR